MIELGTALLLIGLVLASGGTGALLIWPFAFRRGLLAGLMEAGGLYARSVDPDEGYLGPPAASSIGG